MDRSGDDPDDDDDVDGDHQGKPLVHQAFSSVSFKKAVYILNFSFHVSSIMVLVL